MNKSQIIAYYDQTEIDYRLIWHLDNEMAMHYGFWDKGVKSLAQALQRENEVLAQKGKIKKKDLVLDAGCGVGGSSIFLAKKYGCRVVGITLSQKQMMKAKANAIKHQVNHLTDFQVMDFTRTSFENNTFDVVWAIESVCHAFSKKQFIKEAYRILNKGGRLILADFFVKDNLDSAGERAISRWLKCWSVESIESMENFQRFIKETGFKKVIAKDMTQQIMPSAKRLYAYFFPSLLIGWGLKVLGLRSKVQDGNLMSAYYQYQALKRDLWRYGVFYAQKR